MAQLEAAYVVHRYDLAPDSEALVAELAPRLTAIATRGDYPCPARLIARLPHVRVIASSGTGYDGVDVDAARRLGIAVTNSPGAAAECVADAAFALLLATVRRTAALDRFVRAGKWMQDPPPFTADGVGRAPRHRGPGRASARPSRGAPRAFAWTSPITGGVGRRT